MPETNRSNYYLLSVLAHPDVDVVVRALCFQVEELSLKKMRHKWPMHKMWTQQAACLSLQRHVKGQRRIGIRPNWANKLPLLVIRLLNSGRIPIPIHLQCEYALTRRDEGDGPTHPMLNIGNLLFFVIVLSAFWRDRELTCRTMKASAS